MSEPEPARVAEEARRNSRRGQSDSTKSQAKKPSRKPAAAGHQKEKGGDSGAAEPSPVESIRLVRDPARPQTLDYVERLVEDFFELHGDRRYGDDGAIVAGLGRWDGIRVAVVGHQRGRSMSERLARNFGRPNPEGYRKAGRVFELADRFGLPIVTLIDTQGAEPGLGAEERGQAEAIARNLEILASVRVPVVATVIGEGGSGGALAIGLANVVMIQENACYSVITPEGCAAILFREATPEKVAQAAAALKLTASHLLRLRVVDEIIPEPAGGAQRDYDAAARFLGKAVRRHLERLMRLSPERLRQHRERRFARIGARFLSTANGSRTSERRGLTVP